MMVNKRYQQPREPPARKNASGDLRHPFVNGNIEWRRIEALLLALGASRTERAGAAVGFELNGVVAQFHRPHPDKAALRYRVKDARAFLELACPGP